MGRFFPSSGNNDDLGKSWFSFSKDETSNNNDTSNDNTQLGNGSNGQNDGSSSIDMKNESNDKKGLATNLKFHGLMLWGSLAPSYDCKECLFILSSLQLFTGLAIFNFGRKVQFGLRPRQSWRPFNHLNVFVPLPSWPRRILNSLAKTPFLLAGTVLISLSSLEYARLFFPYDPRVEDARANRALTDQVLHFLIKKDDSSDYTKRSTDIWYRWFGATPAFEDIDVKSELFAERYHIWWRREQLLADSIKKKKSSFQDPARIASAKKVIGHYLSVKAVNREAFREILSSESSFENFIQQRSSYQLQDEEKEHQTNNSPNHNENILESYVKENEEHHSHEDDHRSEIIIEDDEDIKLLEDNFDMFWKFRVKPWVSLCYDTVIQLNLIPKSPEYTYEPKKLVSETAEGNSKPITLSAPISDDQNDIDEPNSLSENSAGALVLVNGLQSENLDNES